jgi:RNA polymerase sigma-70 factor (ECF subfamily)
MTDEEITRYALAAGRGDAAAVAAFVRATQADVWRYVAYLADAGAADDLTQETYLRALRGLRSFRGETAARAWLLTIARRTVVDELRRQRHRPRATVTLDEAAVPAVPDASGHVALAALVRRLDPDRRSAFVLTQLLGLPYAEAAAACDVPVGTIRSRVARARADLVRWLAGGSAATDVQAARR